MKFGRFVVRNRVLILILSAILLIPAIFGMMNTRINYDMLTYLPKDLDTVKGQDILKSDFGKGAFSFLIVEGMSPKETAALEKKIEAVDHVDSAIWYDDVADVSVPIEMLPDKVTEAFNKDDETVMAIFFDTGTSEDATIAAVKEIRSIAGKQCYLSGMSALVTDLKALCEKEEPIYVTIAVACACAAMMIFLDSWVVPFLFLAGIGVTIVYNMGTNWFFGEISYITKALAAVLQLAVTMDYSIFLWHSFTENCAKTDDKKEAMARAISDTMVSVTGSSLTTIVGFLALCFMSYTMGRDLGLVMAKGCLFGVIGSVTILPAMILVLDPILEKTRHKPLIHQMNRLSQFVTKHYIAFLIVFILISVPAYYGYHNAPVYYDFTKTVSSSTDDTGFSAEDTQFLTAQRKMEKDFGVASTHMILCDANMSSKDAHSMIQEIEDVDGVKYALGLDSVVGADVPKEMLPKALLDKVEAGDYQMILVNSSYKTSTDEVNNQIDEINTIVKKYDSKALLIGEAPLTKDLISVTAKDFKVVDIISIAAVFAIILIVLKSASLPFILVAVIELAIFINLGIPYYTNLEMPFLAPICISTIQLGSTVDYAILLTTRYKRERMDGNDKKKAVFIALSTSMPSIMVSALCFFAATFGVGLYSDVNLISAMCNLLARGAIVSMLAVLFLLPSMLMLFDKLICASTTDLHRYMKSKKAARKAAVNQA